MMPLLQLTKHPALYAANQRECQTLQSRLGRPGDAVIMTFCHPKWRFCKRKYGTGQYHSRMPWTTAKPHWSLWSHMLTNLAYARTRYLSAVRAREVDCALLFVCWPGTGERWTSRSRCLSIQWLTTGIPTHQGTTLRNAPACTYFSIKFSQQSATAILLHWTYRTLQLENKCLSEATSWKDWQDYFNIIR